MVVIGIVGAHSSGKTTAKSYLEYKLKVRHKVLGFVNEVARDCLLQLNKAGGMQTQWAIISEQISREIHQSKYNKHVICDRTVIDSIAYARYLFDNDIINWEDYQVIEGVATTWLANHPYDAIIYLEPLSFEKDPLRGCDDQEKVCDNINSISIYQSAIDRNLKHALKKYYNGKLIVINYKGEKEERCLEVWRVVRDLLGDDV
jgi:nicotinamide riboside kinase